MVELIEQRGPMVHVRFEGQSWRVEARALGPQLYAGDEELKLALARHAGLPAGRLAEYVVDRHENGNVTVRPEAVFG